jgi:hypothetical protein
MQNHFRQRSLHQKLSTDVRWVAVLFCYLTPYSLPTGHRTPVAIHASREQSRFTSFRDQQNAASLNNSTTSAGHSIFSGGYLLFEFVR